MLFKEDEELVEIIEENTSFKEEGTSVGILDENTSFEEEFEGELVEALDENRGRKRTESIVYSSSIKMKAQGDKADAATPASSSDITQ